MKISDILGMSLSNLWRRKMRTVLTVLGVVIGTASIVVMLSLGIGLRESMMEQASMAGGLTQIYVESDFDYSSSDEKLLGDDTIEKFKGIEHVESVEPQLFYYMPVQAGRYEGYIDIIGVSKSYMKDIELEKGSLPDDDKTALSMVAGNQILFDFWDSRSGDYSEDTPDIDLMTTPLVGGIEIEDTDLYENQQDTSETSDSGYHDSTFEDANKDFDDEEDDFWDFGSENDESDDTEKLSDLFNDDYAYSSFTPDVKRVQLKVTGITEGDEDTYTEYSYACFTDIDNLKTFMKQNYPGNAIIPGQPTDRSGKKYRDIKYSQMVINVDQSDNVEEVLQKIQEMGYRAEANKEWLEEIEKEALIIEAVLGGIGAVAMLVAAISIANTMTMSTYERTKEIGVMKVLGCTLGNIRSMFLAEAAFIGMLGGIIGIGLSFGLSTLANQVIAPMIIGEYSDIELGSHISVIPLWLTFAAILFSTLVGMIAGFFPAQRATKLSPLAAIRNE